MLRLRRAEPSLRTGRTSFLDLPEPLLAFRRGDDLLCAFNLSPGAVEAEVQGGGELLMALDATWDGGVLRLGPNGALIARIGEPAPAEPRLAG
jgi:alpha-glucosidase